MKSLILFFILLPSVLFSQQFSKESMNWLNKNLTAKNVSQDELVTNFRNDDFSSLLLSEQSGTIGFIGG